MVFLFVSGIVERTSEFVEQAPVMRLLGTYLDLVSSPTPQMSGEMKDDLQAGELRRNIKELEPILEATLEGNCESGLYTPKFDVLNDLKVT